MYFVTLRKAVLSNFDPPGYRYYARICDEIKAVHIASYDILELGNAIYDRAHSQTSFDENREPLERRNIDPLPEAHDGNTLVPLTAHELEEIVRIYQKREGEVIRRILSMRETIEE